MNFEAKATFEMALKSKYLRKCCVLCFKNWVYGEINRNIIIVLSRFLLSEAGVY